MKVKGRVILFLAVICLLMGWKAEVVRGQGVLSSKKGVAGPVNSQRLETLKASWFFNWGPFPDPYHEDASENWTAEIWNSFVPLFYGIAAREEGGDTAFQNRLANITSKMQKICSRTDYCSNPAKGYYLIGNEPDVKGQDRLIGSNAADMVINAVKRQGNVAKRILQEDPDAKLIMMGWGDWHRKIDDVAGTTTEDLIKGYITQWKTQWAGDSLIANLANVASGWHFHVYDEDEVSTNRGSDYSVCPSGDDIPRRFLEIVNSEMRKKFGKVVMNQELWVTEMGTLWNVPYETQTAEREKFKDRMRCLVNVFENSPVVTRYAWFYAGCDNGSAVCSARYNLYYSNNSVYTITDLGRLYSTLPNMPNFSLRYSGNCLGSSCDAQCGGGGKCRKITGMELIKVKENIVCWDGANRCSVIENSGFASSPTPRSTTTPTPTPGANLTSTPVPTEQNCTPCSSGVRLKSLGNANCDGKINIFDFAIWKKERIAYLGDPQTRDNWKSDFNCDGKVTGDDLTIWKANQQ